MKHQISADLLHWYTVCCIKVAILNNLYIFKYSTFYQRFAIFRHFIKLVLPISSLMVLK